MSTLRKQLLVGLTALSLGIGAAAASPGMGGGRHMDGEGYSEHRKERMEQRLTELRGKLNLNAQQETAWNAYIAGMKPGERPARPTRAEMEKLSAPERMEQMHARMKVGEQHMAQRVAATRDFYAVLTPEQRKIFDESFPAGRYGRGHHGKS